MERGGRSAVPGAGLRVGTASLVPVYKFLYGAMFALSITVINPWGNDRGDIWVHPKVMVLLGIAVFSLGVVFLARLQAGGGRPAGLGRPGKVAAWLWLLFLAAGLVTALLSPVPLHSALVAHVEMGDGWLYFAILAVFTLANALVLRLAPELFRVQLLGMIAGGVIVALTIFPQVVNWRIDYTDTSGQVSAANPNELVSSMWKGQMPMSFFTSRGHAGFVLAAAAVLALVALLRNWVLPRLAWPAFFVIASAMWFTMSRGVILALLVGLVYVAWRFRRGSKRRLLVAALVLAGSYAAFQGATALLDLRTRNLPSLDASANAISSGRLDLWETSLRGIAQRPLLGWGFNGFGLAWPYAEGWKVHPGNLDQGVPVAKVLSVDHSRFRYIGTDGETHRGWVWTNKAHNVVLDTILSVGVLGFLIYLALFTFVFFVVFRGGGFGLEAVAVVYAVFCLTWFESAQYSHLAWWALSAGLGLWATRPGVPPAEPSEGQESQAAGG